MSQDPQEFAAMSFEQIVDDLERTISLMSDGAIGIEEVTELYERAGALHEAATARLAAISARIEKLTAAPPPIPS